MNVRARIKQLRERLQRGRRRIRQIAGWNRKRRRAIRRLRGELGAKVMFDSVDLSQVPDSAPAVAGYTGGSWPTFRELAKRFPRARTLSIAISAGELAQCLDVEAGDATIAEVPEWVKFVMAHGIKRPVLYTSVSSMDALLATLKAAGIGRGQVRVWSAHYTFAPHLCGPHSCGELRSATADATQWTDKALGRNLDESLLAEGFFA